MPDGLERIDNPSVSSDMFLVTVAGTSLGDTLMFVVANPRSW